jgi:hypothetical protein
VYQVPDLLRRRVFLAALQLLEIFQLLFELAVGFGEFVVLALLLFDDYFALRDH